MKFFCMNIIKLEHSNLATVTEIFVRSFNEKTTGVKVPVKHKAINPGSMTKRKFIYNRTSPRAV